MANIMSSELDNLFGDVMNFMRNPEEFKNVPVAEDPFKPQAVEKTEELLRPREMVELLKIKNHLIFNILHGLYENKSEKDSEREMVELLKRKFSDIKKQLEYHYRRGHNPNTAEILRVLERINLLDLAIFAEEEEKRSVTEIVRKTADVGEELKKAEEEANFWKLMKPVTRHAYDETNR